MKDKDEDFVTAPGGGEETEAAAQALYDADADQRLPFQTERRGAMYPVVIILGSSSLKDAAILDYERAKDQRITEAQTSEADEKDAMAITSQGFRAALDFAIKHANGCEGYAGEPSDKDRAYAVQSILLAVEFEELPLATSDQLCPEDDDDNSTYRLRCLVNGAVVTTVHVLKAATKDQISECQGLMSRTLIVQGTQFGQRDQRIPSRAKRWGELYDQMVVSTLWYARRVPLHHKMAVAIRHLKSEQKAITGN